MGRRYQPVSISPAWLRDCQRYAEETLGTEPALRHIVRPVVHGALVASYLLPLELLEPQNRKRKAPKWVLAKKFEDLKRCLGVQTRFHDHRHFQPLPGRPQVLCTRFSCVEPDKYSDGFKWAIDALCVPSARRTWGLGHLVDDSPRLADVHQWWEPAPRLSGFGLIRVFEGE